MALATVHILEWCNPPQASTIPSLLTQQPMAVASTLQSEIQMTQFVLWLKGPGLACHGKPRGTTGWGAFLHQKVMPRGKVGHFGRKGRLLCDPGRLAGGWGRDKGMVPCAVDGQSANAMERLSRELMGAGACFELCLHSVHATEALLWADTSARLPRSLKKLMV